jgi:hypothetical protein
MIAKSNLCRHKIWILFPRCNSLRMVGHNVFFTRQTAKTRNLELGIWATEGKTAGDNTGSS